MICTSTVSNEVIEYILGLSEVNDAKKRVDALAEGSISFHIPSNPVLQSMCIPLSASIPMRWIKGDTKPHIDKGRNSFHNTYLAYLTDSAGQFVIDGEMHPISKGSAYMFSEGQTHETIGTGTEPRLLLGPMSEQGFPVGYDFTISADGETETIYFRYNSDTFINEYSIDQSSWNTLSLPAFINNTNPNPETHILKCIFTTDLHIGSGYYGNYSCFLCGTNGLQFGSTSLDANGNRPKIMIEDIPDYYGLIQSAEKNNIYIFNLEVYSVGTSSLTLNAGWIGQTYFAVRGMNNYIVNCSSNGDITEQGGGIVGSNAAEGTGTPNSASLYIIGCSSSGAIKEMSGGIVG